MFSRLLLLVALVGFAYGAQVKVANTIGKGSSVTVNCGLMPQKVLSDGQEFRFSPDADTACSAKFNGKCVIWMAFANQDAAFYFRGGPKGGVYSGTFNGQNIKPVTLFTTCPSGGR